MKFYKKPIKGRPREDLLKELDQIQKRLKELSEQSLTNYEEIQKVTKAIDNRLSELYKIDKTLRDLIDRKQELISHQDDIISESERLERRQDRIYKEIYR